MIEYFDYEKIKKGIYTVSEVNFMIKCLVENEPVFHRITIQGEVSNWNIRGSHAYFTLKDENSSINCVMFGAINRLRSEVKDGFHVLATGSIRIYEKRGIYQLYCDEIRTISKIGILYQRFEELKRKLKEEGIFEKEKKKIPRFPKKIGVVTSRDSAALRDIIRTISKKYPLVELFLFHTSVQGDEAKYEIVRALDMAEKFGLDVIILARGGGAIEDLWPFNEEIVVRKLWDMKTPVITGVGHEVDATLVDYVADERRPTPTAAASFAVPDMEELRRTLKKNMKNLQNILSSKIESFDLKLGKLYSDLKRNDPHVKLQNMIDKLESRFGIIEKSLKLKFQILESKLNSSFNSLVRSKAIRNIEEKQTNLTHMLEKLKQIFTVLKDHENSLELIGSKLQSLKPGKPLSRGYAIVRLDGRIITSVEQLNIDDEIEVEFIDGKVRGVVKEVHPLEKDQAP